MNKRKKMILQLNNARSRFIYDLDHTNLAQAFYRLGNRPTPRGRLYHLMPSYMTHLRFGTKLINKLCQSIGTLVEYDLSHPDSKVYVKDIYKRKRLCKYASNVRYLKRLYYYDFRDNKPPRPAKKADVLKALDYLIDNVEKRHII